MTTKWTAGPWHVNAIKDGRVVGDASTTVYDKIQINSSNATVATVYRACDARLIAAAPEMAALLREAAENFDAVVHGGRPIHDELKFWAQARALLARLEKEPC